MGDDYQPADVDERGLWQSLERFEEDLANSSTVLKSPDLQSYTLDVLGRLLGHAPTGIRVYIVRESSFNASMFPNGMMLVQTGFMAHAMNEAQYAAVLGHECGHYFRKHILQGYRDRRVKSAAIAFVGAGANAIGGYASATGHNGQGWIDLANAINTNLVASVFRFSRDLETEADAYGIMMMTRAGYQPSAASDVWRQLIEQRQRSAAMRDKRFKPSQVDTLSTHPPEQARMKDLLDTAEELKRHNSSTVFEDGADRWRAAIKPHRAMLLEEQVKLNDPGASLYLIEQHAKDSWDGELRFFQGEVYRLRGAEGDKVQAAEAYAAAVAFQDAPASAWKAHGYELLKSGNAVEGKAALSRYLELQPEAPDAAMVKFTINQ